MRKNSDVITLVVKYSNIRLSKELDCILIMSKSGHFSDVVLIQFLIYLFNLVLIC